jgi:hypothetical protein
MNLKVLRDELITDPLARGYAAMLDQQAANSLNAVDRSPDRRTIDGGEIASAIVRSEFNSRPQNDKDYLSLVVRAGSVPLTAALKTEITNLFPVNSATRANLIMLFARSLSRAGELGLGGVTAADVAKARRQQ